MLANGGTFQFGPIDYVSTARTFLFHHQDVLTDDPELADIIMYEYMEGDPKISAEINNLATKMRQLGPPTEISGWARLLPFTPEQSGSGRAL